MHRNSETLVRGETGFAVIVAMMGLLLISALGAALVLTTSVETMIARNFREGAGALYAADAVAVHAAEELATLADWNGVLEGSTHSALVDGPPGGVRTLEDGAAINLTEIQNLANCGAIVGCGDAALNATDAGRPWGLNNPRWQLFAWGRLTDLLGAPSRFYVVLLVADDPSETDGNALADGDGPENPGSGMLSLRAEAFGPGGAHGIVELTIARVNPDVASSRPEPLGVRVVSWRAGA